jgi:hypothetical protein
MTELRKELNQAKQEKKDARSISKMSSGAIVWFLVRRHADNLTFIVVCLVLGWIIGTKI